MHRKISQIPLFLVVIILMLTACSQGENNGENSSQTAPSQSTSSQSMSSQDEQIALPVNGVSFGMDTFIEQSWYGENAQSVYDEIISMIANTERTLSMHDEDSNIAKINANAGIESVEIDKSTYEFLEYAKSLSEKYRDYFDITIAPVTRLWGITSPTPTIPDDEELKIALELVNIDNLILTQESNTYTAYLNTANMALDLGAVAKGYAVSLAVDIAHKYDCNGFLSIGGNVGAVGTKPDDINFKIGLRNPDGEQSDYVAIITLEDYTMATTGAYERFFEVGGEQYHHVFSPTTGYPAETDIKSATVISENGAMADALSTVMFVAGKDYALEMLSNDDFVLIIIDNENKIHVSESFKDSIVLNTQNDNFTFAN